MGKFKKLKKMKKKKGFTMVELVITIVILGILAGYAIPKIADLRREARIGRILNHKKTLEYVTEIVHAKALVQGKIGIEDKIIIQGEEIRIRRGYPIGCDLNKMAHIGFVSSPKGKEKEEFEEFLEETLEDTGVEKKEKSCESGWTAYLSVNGKYKRGCSIKYHFPKTAEYPEITARTDEC